MAVTVISTATAEVHAWSDSQEAISVNHVATMTPCSEHAVADAQSRATRAMSATGYAART